MKRRALASVLLAAIPAMTVAEEVAAFSRQSATPVEGWAPLASGALAFLLAVLLCRILGLFQRFRRPSGRVLCILAAALVLHAGAITARSKGSIPSFLATPRVVHFADEPEDGTLAEVEEVIKESVRMPANAFASRTTVEALLADDGQLFEAVFSHDPPCVYIEGSSHDASDLAPLFEKYGARIEAWVRDGGRLLVNAQPSTGSCALPFGASFTGRGGSGKLSPYFTLYSQFFMAPTPIEGGEAAAWNGQTLSGGIVNLDGIYGSGDDQEWFPWHIDPEIAYITSNSGSGVGIGMIAPKNCLGTVTYSTLRGPSHFHMTNIWEEGAAEVVSTNGIPLWERLLYWAFREDGLITVPPERDSEGILPISGRFLTAAGTVSTNSADLYVFNDSNQGFRTVATSECDWLQIASPTNFSWPGCRWASENNNVVHVTLTDAVRNLPQGVYTGSVVIANTRDFDPDATSRWQEWESPPAPLTPPEQYTFPSAQRNWFILTVGDPPPYAGTFSIAEGGGLVVEAGGAVVRFTIVRETPDLPAALVMFRTEDDSAIAGVDYGATWRTLQFPEGVATNVVEIPILDNARLHTYSPSHVAPRRFGVRIYSPSAGAVLGDEVESVVTIADDELVPHAWFVRPATGGWDDADTAALRNLLHADGTLPTRDILSETFFEDADPAELFGPASDCVFLDFGPRDGAYVASFLGPWRDRIEDWVRHGGRLFLNASPQEGSAVLPFGLTLNGGQFIESISYFIYDALPMTPTPLMGGSDTYTVTPAAGVPDIATATIHLTNDNAPKMEYDEIHSVRLSDGGFARIGHNDGWIYTDLGWDQGHGYKFHSYDGPYLLVSEGAGSVAYSTYRPPAQLVARGSDGTSLWGRLLLWAFRNDGFGLTATEDWRTIGDAGDADTFFPTAKTYGVHNLGTRSIDVTVSSDVDWLVVESSTATLPAGRETSFRISLSPEALAFPAGTYTGTVSFASSRDFCHEADVGGWGTITYPPPEFRRTVVLTVTPVTRTLAVTSAHGAPSPASGSAVLPRGETVQASVAEPESIDGWRYICAGWIGTGSIPATGTGTNVAFAIEEDSSLTWLWETNVWIECSATGGTVDTLPQWVPLGDTVVAHVEPAYHLFDIDLAGDIDGVTLDGTTVVLPADRPRSVEVVVTEIKLALDVESAQGEPAPAVGRSLWSWGDTVEASIAEPETADGWRFTCTGWIGTGSVPAAGSGTNVAFVIAEDSSLAWLWETNVWIECSATGGTVVFDAGWSALGNVLEARIAPASANTTLWLEGDADGVEVDASGRILTIPANRPRKVDVLYDTFAGEPIDWGGWTGDAAWHAVADPTASDGVSLRSGEVAAGGTSALEAHVSGMGTLSFDWRISSQRGNHARLYVDGERLLSITRMTDWTSETVLLDHGEHTLRWTYEKGSGATGGDDAAFLDNVCWTPATLADALDATNIVWTTSGDAPWFPQRASTADGEDAARSGACVGDASSSLEAHIDGPGTLSWRWWTDIADNAGVDVYLDGRPLYADGLFLEGPADIAEASLHIDGVGQHTVVFEFWNCGTEATISDCAYLDMVSWTPDKFTLTTPEPVPYSWLDTRCPALVAAHGGDYEAAAWSIAANGENAVWECYVTGIDPIDASARFLARIDMLGDVVIVTPDPDLNEGGARHEREYRILGKRSLDATENWVDVTGLPHPGADGHRFFRITVSLP